jgi:AcrR family transcriptional regulator
MARTPGSRNQDYAETRRRLATTVSTALVRDDGRPATFRDLARAANVSEPTLKHYFKDHEGVIIAALEVMAENARGVGSMLEPFQKLTAPRALKGFLLRLVDGFRHFGVGAVFSGGLSVGLGHPRLGPAFVSCILEPTLVHTETLLASLQAQKKLRKGPVREWAVSIAAPVVLALLHQDPLGGRSVRPLDLNAFIEAHVDLLLQGLMT